MCKHPFPLLTRLPAWAAAFLPLFAFTPVLLSTALAATFEQVEIAPEHGVQNFDLPAARALVERELLGAPDRVVTLGSMDLYDRFPFVETRAVQVVADPGWDRLVAGMTDVGFTAWDGVGTSFGPLRDPHGLAADEWDCVYVADTGRDRVLVLQVSSSSEGVELEPLFEISSVVAPYGVAYSDGGTPWDRRDDRLYVTEAGRNRVVRFDLEEGAARRGSELGELGSGAGAFAGPLAIAAQVRSPGVNEVYVLDAHNRRIVQLEDGTEGLRWMLARSWSPVTVQVRGLSVDRWGNVYAGGEDGRVYKWNPRLEPVGAYAVGRGRLADVHLPRLTVRDHRTGSTRRVTQARALVLDDWRTATGMGLWRLGADVDGLTVRAEPATDHARLAGGFVLTDRAAVVVEVIRAEDGETLARSDLGVRDAGRILTSLPIVPRDGLVFRVTATSAYEGGGTVRRETTFGPPVVTSPLSDRVEVVATPNPFRDVVLIRARGVSAGTSVYIFDLAGRRLRSLTLDASADGAGTSWDGRDGAGHPLPQGIYLYRVGEGEAAYAGKVLRLQ